MTAERNPAGTAVEYLKARRKEEKTDMTWRNSLLAAAALTLLSGPVFAQSAWTGGDDLPTNPLACDGTAAAAAAKPYDGGSPTNGAGGAAGCGGMGGSGGYDGKGGEILQ